MTDYEKGTAAWDIGQIMTRHGKGITRNIDGTVATCARIEELRRSAQANLSGAERIASHDRLDLALAVSCTCGAGDSDSERTSLNAPVANRDSV